MGLPPGRLRSQRQLLPRQQLRHKQPSPPLLPQEQLPLLPRLSPQARRHIRLALLTAGVPLYRRLNLPLAVVGEKGRIAAAQGERALALEPYPGFHSLCLATALIRDKEMCLRHPFPYVASNVAMDEEKHPVAADALGVLVQQPGLQRGLQLVLGDNESVTNMRLNRGSDYNNVSNNDRPGNNELNGEANDKKTRIDNGEWMHVHAQPLPLLLPLLLQDTGLRAGFRLDLLPAPAHSSKRWLDSNDGYKRNNEWPAPHTTCPINLLMPAPLGACHNRKKHGRRELNGDCAWLSRDPPSTLNHHLLNSSLPTTAGTKINKKRKQHHHLQLLMISHQLPTTPMQKMPPKEAAPTL